MPKLTNNQMDLHRHHRWDHIHAQPHKDHKDRDCHGKLHHQFERRVDKAQAQPVKTPPRSSTNINRVLQNLWRELSKIDPSIHFPTVYGRTQADNELEKMFNSSKITLGDLKKALRKALIQLPPPNNWVNDFLYHSDVSRFFAFDYLTVNKLRANLAVALAQHIQSATSSVNNRPVKKHTHSENERLVKKHTHSENERPVKKHTHSENERPVKKQQYQPAPLKKSSQTKESNKNTTSAESNNILKLINKMPDTPDIEWEEKLTNLPSPPTDPDNMSDREVNAMLKSDRMKKADQWLQKLRQEDDIAKQVPHMTNEMKKLADHLEKEADRYRDGSAENPLELKQNMYLICKQIKRRAEQHQRHFAKKVKEDQKINKKIDKQLQHDPELAKYYKELDRLIPDVKKSSVAKSDRSDLSLEQRLANLQSITPKQLEAKMMNFTRTIRKPAAKALVSPAAPHASDQKNGHHAHDQKGRYYKPGQKDRYNMAAIQEKSTGKAKEAVHAVPRAKQEEPVRAKHRPAVDDKPIIVKKHWTDNRINKGKGHPFTQVQAETPNGKQLFTAELLNTVPDEVLRANGWSDKEINGMQNRKKSHRMSPEALKALGCNDIVSHNAGRFYGKGSFGMVKPARITLPGTSEKVWCVAKKIVIDSHEALEETINEVRLQAQSGVGVKIHGIAHTTNKKGQRQCIIFMDKVKGMEAAHWIIENQHNLSFSDKATLAENLIQKVATCHKNRVFHRDLKWLNCGIDPKTLSVEMLDFGLGTTQKHNYNAMPDDPVGPGYRPPECYGDNRNHHSYQDQEKVDVYSLGVMLGQLFGSCMFMLPLWDHRSLQNPQALIDRELRKSGIKDSRIKSLIERMVQADPNKRPSMKEIIEQINQLKAMRPNKPDYQARRADIHRPCGMIARPPFNPIFGRPRYVY